MKLNKRLATLVLMTLLIVAPTFASQVPKDIKDYILKTFPNATIRFDGMVVLSDGTKYLPVYPAISMVNANLAIKYTQPANTTFSKKPDIVVFDNNFALLKLVSAKDNKLTIAQSQKYPMEIKTGLLPQDLIVPSGLMLPEELSGILGNLEIPLYPIAVVQPISGGELKSSNKSNLVRFKDSKKEKNDKKTAKMKQKGKVSVQGLPEELVNKRYLVTNLDTEYINVIPATSTEPKFTLKLDTIAYDLKVTADEAYVLLTKANSSLVDIVDLFEEEIIKQIDLSVQPNEILITPDSRFAYVTSLDDHSIFIIDLNSMKIAQKIQVTGMPEKLSLSNDGKKLIYYDKMSSNLYCVDLQGKYISTLIGYFPNGSKFLYLNNKIYALLRTKNLLEVKNFVAPEYKGDEKVVKDAETERSTTLLDSTNNTLYRTSSARANSKHTIGEKSNNSPYVDNGAILPLLVTNKIENNEDVTKIEVSNKPVDMLVYGKKLFVLSAKNNKLNVINLVNNSLIQTIDLPIKGFCKKITPVPNSDLALITNVTEKKYIIFDMSENEVLQVLPIGVSINNIVILRNKK